MILKIKWRKTMNLIKHLDIVINASILAGKEIVKIYNTDFSNTIEYKEDHSPLTIADKTSNDIIINILKKEFPDISILSEESKLDSTRFNNDYCWIIDPLDGTKEYVKKNDEFTVNVALAYKKKVVLGAVYIPVTDTLFYASKGMGAFKRVNSKTIKIKVSDKLDDLTIACSRSHVSEKLEELIEEKNNIISNTITVGSSIKGTLVAEGKADVYYRFGYTNEWDTAAMQCVVEEAGGIFRQIDGSEMLYNRKNTTNELGFYIVNRKENIWI